MKFILKSTLIILSAALLSSCYAVHAGYLTDSAALSSANFNYANKNIKGTSQATYILGIGGLAKETLTEDAKKQMLASNPLKANQTLANISVNFKTTSYVGVYATVVCTVTADVVEFK